MGLRVALVVMLAAAAAGCSHGRAYLALDREQREAVAADLGVAGVLDCRTEKAVVAREATALLVNASGARDLSAVFGPDALAALTASPSGLLVQADALAKIRAAVGCRYVLVGRQGSALADRRVFWCPYVPLPFPYVSVGSQKSLQVSEQSEVAHASQILRVIDLQEAAVIAESHMVLSEAADPGGRWRGDIREPLAGMALK